MATATTATKTATTTTATAATAPTTATTRFRPEERVNVTTSIPFFLVHLTPLAIFFTGVSAGSVALCVGLFFGRMFFITAGYHRYFAHKSYKLRRVPQFLIALGGATAAQKGPLWWAAHHRNHHRYADTDKDVHSPLRGFWWSHVIWILCDRFSATDEEAIPDLMRYPELRFLNRHDWIGPVGLGAGAYLVGGLQGLFVGFFLSTVLLWHATFTVNSLAHVMGRRRYATSDTSRNSLLIALLTMGEGWHNNHHYWPASARQGFFWWEVDMTYYILRGLSFAGIVQDLRRPPARVLGGARVREGHFDLGMFRASLMRARESLAGVGSAAGQAVGSVRQRSSETVERQSQALEERLQSLLQSAEELGRLSRRARKGARATESAP